MANDPTTITEKKAQLNIPPETDAKFHELIGMIQESSSMDNDERQYWIDVLPIMTDDQITNLRGILENEKKQLADAASAYSQGMEKAVKNVANEFDEKAYLEKKRARQAVEAKQEAAEIESEENILKSLEDL